MFIRYTHLSTAVTGACLLIVSIFQNTCGALFWKANIVELVNKISPHCKCELVEILKLHPH